MDEDAGPLEEVTACIDLEGESTEEEVERGSLRGVAVPAIPGPAEVLEVGCSIERLDPRALPEAGATVVDWTGPLLECVGDEGVYSLDPKGSPPENMMKGSSFLHDFHSSLGMARHGSILRSSVMFLA